MILLRKVSLGRVVKVLATMLLFYNLGITKEFNGVLTI